MDGLSCVSTVFCVATGTGTGDIQAFDEWTGSQWRRMSRAHDDVVLTSVSCVSTVRCVAVGDFRDDQANPIEVAERWNGKTWLDPVTMPGHSGTMAVSCASPSVCMAVGTYGNPTLTTAFDQADRWNGGAWHLVKPPCPAATRARSTWALAGADCKQCPALAATCASRSARRSGRRWHRLGAAASGGSPARDG